MVQQKTPQWSPLGRLVVFGDELKVLRRVKSGKVEVRLHLSRKSGPKQSEGNVIPDS